jgi:hypothetical protein
LVVVLSRDEAEALVLAGCPDGQWFVSSVIERPWGWVMLPEPLDPDDMVFGFLTKLVERDTGALLTVTRSVEASIACYEAGEWDPLDLGRQRLRAACAFGREAVAWRELEQLAEHGADAIELGWARLEVAGVFGRAAEMRRALVALAANDADSIRLERVCVQLLDGPEPDVARGAAACLGGLARRYGVLRKPSEVVAALRVASRKPALAEACAGALDDIASYAGAVPASDATWDRWIDSARRNHLVDPAASRAMQRRPPTTAKHFVVVDGRLCRFQRGSDGSLTLVEVDDDGTDMLE